MYPINEASPAGDVMDVVINLLGRAMKQKEKRDREKKNYLNGSISNYTKNLVMTFPMLCDNSLPPETASMISRANERNIVSMLEILFSSMPINAANGAETIAKVHQNINSNPTMDDAIDSLDNFIDKNNLTNLAYNPFSVNASYEIPEVELKRVINEMVAELKRPVKRFPVNSFSERSLNEYTVYNNYGKINVREDAPPLVGKSQNELDKMKAGDMEKELNKIRYLQTQTQIQQMRANMDKDDGSNIDKLTKRLLDVDVKKSNELQPTLMIVYFTNNEKEKPFISGVKSRLISVDSVDIVDRVVAKNKTKLSFLNLIRATTGEIKFFRDFLFCIDQSKLEAKNSSKKGQAAAMWKVLETRATKNNRNKSRKSGNDASAITTLVVNQETVNFIKKNYDFDLEKLSNARMILDAYNLLGLFIADESVEVVKCLYTGNDSFEQQAYSYLEKESKDSSYKKIINLMSKANGR